MAESGRRRIPLFRWAAWALLLCAGFIIAEPLIHTDDGCEVEIHCLACRWAYASSAVFVAAPAPAVAQQLCVPLSTEPASALHGRTLDVPAPRGPPAA